MNRVSDDVAQGANRSGPARAAALLFHAPITMSCFRGAASEPKPLLWRISLQGVEYIVNDLCRLCIVAVGQKRKIQVGDVNGVDIIKGENRGAKADPLFSSKAR